LHRQPVALHVDKQLAETGMALAVHGAYQRDHEIGILRAAGPDLLAVDLPAALNLAAAGPDAREIGARAGLAHADAERVIAGRDARQQTLALHLGAEAQQQRAALAVGNPV